MSPTFHLTSIIKLEICLDRFITKLIYMNNYLEVIQHRMLKYPILSAPGELE